MAAHVALRVSVPIGGDGRYRKIVVSWCLVHVYDGWMGIMRACTMMCDIAEMRVVVF